MDPRVREHAQIVADHSTEIQPEDLVVISTPPHAADLAVALHEVVGERGATPIALSSNERAERAYLRASDPDEIQTPTHTQALYEEADVLIRVRSAQNATETSDVSTEVTAAKSRAYEPVQEAALENRWCLTQFPSAGNAQLAEMSTAQYQNFVWDAINRDWDDQRAHQEQMVEYLDPAQEIRIQSGSETDITMSLDGMVTLNDFGEKNLPGGEVFTAPVPDSVEGTVLFDKPLYHQGREVNDVLLEFEAGEVVSHSAAKHEAVLSDVLDTDDGARRLGELGIGMNRGIDEFSYNMLFDEKMGDTVHMALGRAYPETVGESQECNESAVHVDMIVDMSERSTITVDGEVVQRDGRFVFEDGFET